MTTKIRARNEASGELKYQPSKHTKSMINYSITMRSVNSNLLIFMTKDRVINGYFVTKDRVIKRCFMTKDRVIMGYL